MPPRRVEVFAGDRFGRLVLAAEISSRNQRRRGRFRCDCGRVVEVALHDVRYGHTTSCGCFHRERQRAPKSHGETTGRRSGSAEYRAWKAMKGRCLDPKSDSYPNYGGRGITVCSLWRHDFEAFLAHVGRKPGPAYSLDRIENDGNYEPGNVRWATRAEQRANQRKR